MSRFFGEMLDTTETQRRRYYALLRGLTPEQRAHKVGGLSRAVRALAESDIKRRYPAASARELSGRLAERLYGAEIAARFLRRG